MAPTSVVSVFLFEPIPLASMELPLIEEKTFRLGSQMGWQSRQLLSRNGNLPNGWRHESTFGHLLLVEGKVAEGMGVHERPGRTCGQVWGSGHQCLT